MKKLKFTFDDRLRSVPNDMTLLLKKINELKENTNTEDILAKVNALGELGVYLRINGELDFAEEALTQALTLISEHKLSKKKKVQNEIRIGHVYQFQKKFNISNELFLEVIESCLSQEDLKYYLPFAYQHSGKNMFDQGDFKSALKLFNSALKLRIKDDVPVDQLQSTEFAIQRTKELIEREKLLADMYDKVAHNYTEKVEESNYIGPSWLMKNLSEKSKNSNLNYLDLACANGINMKNLSSLVPGLLAEGVDISPSMLENARKLNIYKNLYLANLDRGLPFVDDVSVDVVIALGFLEFVTHLEFLLDEVSRVSKNNAEIYASFQLFDPKIEYAIKTSRSGKVIHFAYTESEVKNFFVSRGFAIHKLEKLTGYTGGYPCQYIMVYAQKR